LSVFPDQIEILLTFRFSGNEAYFLENSNISWPWLYLLHTKFQG